MEHAFFVACECGGTSFSNHVRISEKGHGVMVSLCMSCFNENKETELCEDSIGELISGPQAQSIFF